MLIGYSVALYLVIGLCEGQMNTDEVYVLNFDSPVYVCADELSQGFMDTSNLEVERINETLSIMKGPFNYLKKLESCVKIELIIEKEANGRRDVVLTHEICDLCAEIKQGEDSKYHKFLRFFDFKDACPFDGEYAILDLIADTDDMPINRANSARYQLTINYFVGCDCKDKDKGDFKGCLQLDFVIKPL